MITWNRFRSGELEPDWRIEVNEYNVRHFVKDDGPSQFKRMYDAPMLEVSHERQFAVSQLGTQSVGFEAQHTHRIKDTLRQISRYFARYKLDESCQPSSPYAEYLPDIRISSPLPDPLPPLDVSDVSSPDRHPDSPLPSVESENSSRSTMALQEMMNPEPPRPSLGKRKWSPCAILPLSPEDPGYEEDLSLDNTNLVYARANHPAGEQFSRTRRGVRMRRSRSLVRTQWMQNTPDTEWSRKRLTSS
ncbi:uncharacterized protein Z518_04654 [Rhinocladiella mackenziei CBS 650.93]|uniref:Uncharacterized protein n=1 Tax=Rhinocladiella mackenziei CBS 650.93 TaxID=1442369 RepID=A0A0D2H8B3_9EURO|nr:uncharacterized protein Z518_04654 [Rhinocladiella mackenziei CBS 650.93]KIX06678.1 hypothetical protein Z518_04654 [Rhinocladiella mackenziei CBS 650.93]